MRISICLAALAALVAAAPHPQNQLPTDIPVSISATIATATVSVIPSTSLNIPVTTVSVPVLPTGLVPLNSTRSSTSKRRGGHSEPVPIFSRFCDCPLLATIAYPCYATDALASCNFEENHSWVCWTSANFGCPSPTRACSDLFKPTPVTGRHPCDLSPPTEPTITAAAIRH
ncbi:hypothetical protein K505DRAFT_10888 [Melanomma pulvis-pyrius CBS 109.77]|uniref:Extracellular membrane protein CFEM domain-containing protein n=1 Tax=Melanomma pulvis-pyrius CBS 109.77 TaxID=1314802 RepID=A0A6A6XIZ3_9PLEO|nr:hypothetical protein K505DRAFT_10888 [Melanomma pulvis-pyrius CBS 109.77]